MSEFTEEQMKQMMKCWRPIVEGGAQQASPSQVAAPAGSGVALPITDRPKAYRAWRDRLAADPSCWTFSGRDDAVAFAAFVAGWWLRTGDDPDGHWNPPNEKGQR